MLIGLAEDCIPSEPLDIVDPLLGLAVEYIPPGTSDVDSFATDVDSFATEEANFVELK